MLVLVFLPRYLAIGGGATGVVLFAIMTGASADQCCALHYGFIGFNRQSHSEEFIPFLGVVFGGIFMVCKIRKF